MQKHLGIWKDHFGWIWTLGDALGPELWLYLCFVLALIILIFNISMYVGIYKCISSYLDVYGSIWRYMEVYWSIWRYVRIDEPTFSTLFFFYFLCVHFFGIVFCQLCLLPGRLRPPDQKRDLLNYAPPFKPMNFEIGNGAAFQTCDLFNWCAQPFKHGALWGKYTGAALGLH